MFMSETSKMSVIKRKQRLHRIFKTQILKTSVVQFALELLIRRLSRMTQTRFKKVCLPTYKKQKRWRSKRKSAWNHS